MGRTDTEDKLSLVDASAMAMGGMIGGGIFAVLGEGVRTAGNATFLAFGLAGLLALLTGLSYSRLTLHYDEPGGSFTFVERLVGSHTAGTLSWFLLLGIGIIAALAGLNLLGVRESGSSEDVLRRHDPPGGTTTPRIAFPDSMRLAPGPQGGPRGCHAGTGSPAYLTYRAGTRPACV